MTKRCSFFIMTATLIASLCPSLYADRPKGSDKAKVDPSSPWGGMEGGRNGNRKAYESGTRFTRSDFCWFRVEFGQDRWKWEFADRSISERYKEGIITIPILLYGPTWDRAYFQHSIANYDDFGDYVYHTVERYDADGVADAPGSPRIDIYEIWNEPGLHSPYWNGNEEDYYRLLKVAYRNAKAADPTCKVLSGTDIPVHAPYYGDDAELMSHHMYRKGDWRDDMETFSNQVRSSENKMNAAGVFGKLHTNLEWNTALFNRQWGPERWHDYDVRESIMCLHAGVVLLNGPQCMSGLVTANVLGIPAKLGLLNSIDQLRLKNPDHFAYVVRRADGTAAAVAWDNGPWEKNPVSTLTLGVGRRSVVVVGQYGFEKKYDCPQDQLSVRLTRSPCFIKNFVDNVRPTIGHKALTRATAGHAVKVTAELRDVSPTRATLFWRPRGGSDFQSKPMVRTKTAGRTDSYVAYIPIDAVKARGVDYYVEGSDTWANKVFAPAGGAQKPAAIEVRVGKPHQARPPKIVHDSPAEWKAGFYVKLKATITDDIGIEKATLYYRSAGRDKFKPLVMNVYAPDNAYFARIPAEAARQAAVEYYIKAEDREGSPASFSPAHAPEQLHRIKLLVDKRPPAAPRSTAAETLENYKYLWTMKDAHRAVKVSWANNSEDDLDGYNVYRSETKDGPFLKLNHVPLTNPYHVSTQFSTSPPPLKLGRTYHWVITAVDTSGNESERSKVVQGALGPLDDRRPPPAPRNLRIDKVANKEVGTDLTINPIWDAVSAADLNHYRLYRASTSGGPYRRINTSDGWFDDRAAYSSQSSGRQGGKWKRLSTIYHDRDVKDKAAYFYVVTAVDHSGNESAKSNELKAVARDDPTRIGAHIRYASGLGVHLLVRGQRIPAGGPPAVCWGWDTPLEFWTSFEVGKKNLLAVAGSGPSMFYLNAIFDDGSTIVSDGSWKVLAKPGLEARLGGPWAENVDFDDSAWQNPMELGTCWEFLPTMNLLPQTQAVQPAGGLKGRQSLLARKLFIPTAEGVQHAAERVRPRRPSAPSNVQAEPLWPNRIVVKWTDNDPPEARRFLPADGFSIERSMDGTSGWKAIGTVGTNVLTCLDTDVQQDKRYYYRARAFNEAGHSDYSKVGYGLIPSVSEEEASRRLALDDLKIKAVMPDQIGVGKRVKLTALLTHRFRFDAPVEVRVTGFPEGWVLKPGSSQKYIIKGNSKQAQVNFQIEIPADVTYPYGRYGFALHVRYQGKVIHATDRQVVVPVLAKNLARQAKASTDAHPKMVGREGALSGGDKAINDGNLGSWSSKVYGKQEYYAQLDWDQSRTFNAVAVNANWGKGPRSFDILVDGKKIGTRKDVQYVGDMYFTRIPEVSAKTLRLRIFDCYHGPVIMEVRVFRLSNP